MSYILDALRKSDQQRQRGAAPTLLAGQATAVAPKQPAFLAYGLLAAVLVGAGMAIGWLRPWQPASAPSEMAPKPELQVQNATPSAQAAPALVPTKPQRPARAKPKTDGTPREADAAVPGKTAPPPPEQPVGTADADAARVQTVISMAELPLPVQQELPPMEISVHAYSANPGDRLVGINNRMLREGAYVVPGLKLEQITPPGEAPFFPEFQGINPWDGLLYSCRGGLNPRAFYAHDPNTGAWIRDRLLKFRGGESQASEQDSTIA
jgi:general secretion pathway protein B